MRSAMTRMIPSLLATMAIAGSLLAAGRAGEPAAVVTMIEGSATVSAAGARTGTAVKRNDRLMRDQEVLVGEQSRIELRYPDGTVMRFGERSRIRIEEMSYDDRTQSKKIKVALERGKLWANVMKLVTADSKVEVRTVNAVAGVRGTVYRVTVEEDAGVLVKVYDGSVYVTGFPHEVPKPAAQVPGPVPVPGPHEGPAPYREVSREEWTVIVRSMQQVSISPQGDASKPQDFDLRQDQDDWVRWNQERDRELVL